MSAPRCWNAAYRVDDAAAVLGVSRHAVYALWHAGELELGKLAGRTVVRGSVLEEFLARREAAATAPVPAPAPEPAPTCGVYLLTKGESVAYVGRSTNLKARLRTHRHSGREFDEARVIPCDAETAVWLERELIRTLQPIQNRVRYERHARAARRKLEGLN